MAAKIQRVQVTRSFRHRGEDYGTGSVLDLDLPSAQELRTARKAEFVGPEAKVVKLGLPPKKERPAKPEAAQVALLSAQVATLTALVEKLSAPKVAAKEKANA